MKKSILILTALVVSYSCTKQESQNTPNLVTSSDVAIGTPNGFNGEIAYPGEEGTTMEIPMKNGEMFYYEKFGGDNIVEGDIMLTDEDLKEIATFDPNNASEGIRIASKYAWKANTITYRFHSNVSSSLKSRILTTMDYIKARTKIKFRERTNQYAYVYIQQSSGNSATVGFRNKGAQSMRLTSNASRGTIIHEIFHVWGLYHEQSRHDRDSHVTVNYGNIRSGKSHNYNKYGNIQPGYTTSGSFDFNSIMMYGPYYWSKNGNATMTKKDGSIYSFQRSYISSKDKVAVNGVFSLPW